MKIFRLCLFSVIVVLALQGCKVKDKVTQNLNHPFGMCHYDGGILVSNLGGKSVDYFSKAPKGFITHYKNGKNRVVVEPNGVLFAPKGLAVKDDFLFVADLGKVVVFDLKQEAKLIDQVKMPQQDAFVSDVLVLGGTLFITVTNYNKIYVLNIENPLKIDHTSLLEYLEMPYPSTIRAASEYVFVNSNSFDGTPYEDKIIHIIDNLLSPSLRPILHDEGDYQGMEFSPEGTRMIFSNQERRGEIGNVVFENGECTYEKVGESDAIFSSLLMFDNKLYICDLENSEILIKEIIEIDGFPTIIKSKNKK